MSSAEKQAFRQAFSNNAKHVWKVCDHEQHARNAERWLGEHGIQGSLLRYLEGIGRAYGSA